MKIYKITLSISPYAWIGPDTPYFATGTAPQNGSKILGPANRAQAVYSPSVKMYNLLCLYPTGASTTRVPLPANTG